MWAKTTDFICIHVTSCSWRRMVFKLYEERKKGAEKIEKEANDIERLFMKSLSDPKV